MTMPQIPPAGITSSLAETAKDALTWDPTRPQTPGDIKKYRQSTLHEPGAIVRHPGQAEDPVPQGVFGVKSAAAEGQSVLEALVNYPESELARWKIERAEEIYSRCATRPSWRPGCYMGETACSPVGLAGRDWLLGLRALLCALPTAPCVMWVGRTMSRNALLTWSFAYVSAVYPTQCAAGAAGSGLCARTQDPRRPRDGAALWRHLRCNCGCTKAQAGP